ncbi:MAG: tRNA (guanosine(46)-N7)-methyltransferase TrmB [Hyphomicrobiales bacterium]|jgi:tRNA (guanine-N7-)-methyltransferase|nr:tRNA (guanosine(46)-N7)-methyltransferase TrmB [Alphaproteobacteria bacterium]MDG1524315.1 tRNA (guanosine(46)-N7)-methyltransferase TrmB [Hyphomicrobiales bacterium]|tara:strand:- start:529 stop:1203 length:675 start_codon:yes stop_codon:yes gene_type:complete
MPSSKIKKNIITVRGRERSLTPKQRSLFSNLDKYEIDLTSLKKDNIHKSKKLFFEIGFGSGDIIYKQAKLNPENIYIGIEYYRKGIAQLIEKIETTKLENLKIFHGDARRVLANIPDEIFDEIWLFFPDPWPKKRHSKRRFIQLEMIELLHRKIKQGGKLLISSDDKNYIAWTLSLIFMRNFFNWLSDEPSDWKHPNNDYFGSKYEKKGIKSDREPYFLKFLKI